MGCGISSPALSTSNQANGQAQPNESNPLAMAAQASIQSNVTASSSSEQPASNTLHRISRLPIHKQLLAKLSKARTALSSHTSTNSGKNVPSTNELFSSVTSAAAAAAALAEAHSLHLVNKTQFNNKARSTQCPGGILWLHTDVIVSDQYAQVYCMCAQTQTDFEPFEPLVQRIACAVQNISHAMPITNFHDDSLESELEHRAPPSAKAYELLVLSNTKSEHRSSRIVFRDAQNIEKSPLPCIDKSTYVPNVLVVRKRHVSTQLRPEKRSCACQTELSIVHKNASELLLQIATHKHESPKTELVQHRKTRSKTKHEKASKNERMLSEQLQTNQSEEQKLIKQNKSNCPPIKQSSIESVITITNISYNEQIKDQIKSPQRCLSTDKVASKVSSSTSSSDNEERNTRAEQWRKAKKTQELHKPIGIKPKWTKLTSNTRSQPNSPRRRPSNRDRNRVLQKSEPRPHSADSARKQRSIPELLAIALSADAIDQTDHGQECQTLLQEYLKSLLLKVHLEQDEKHKIRRRNASIQTVNDLVTDESPEFTARCPSLRKKELLYMPNLFDEIDKKVLQSPDFCELTKLVQHLIDSCENELFKVRAIFRWICANISFNWNYVGVVHLSDTTNEEPTGNAFAGWAESIFRRREGASREYCVLFCRMCQIAAIRCKRLQGFAKNYDYRPGHRYVLKDAKNDALLHHWCAVFVLGNWHFVDITWATGYTDPTNPENMIWSHFPVHFKERDYGRWQLLDRPITLDQFNDLPKVTASFFEFNLKLRTRLANPVVFRVQTELKVASHEPMRYKHKLFPAEQMENGSLNNYVFCQLKEERLVGSFLVGPPMEGRFFLKLYAKPEKQMQGTEDGGSLIYVATLLLDCQKARKYQEPYPPNELPWGPAACFYDYHMQLLNQRSAVISTWGGKRRLVMQCAEPMLLTYQITDTDAQEVDSRTMISRDDQSATNLITLHILPPRVGMFKITIFGMPKPKQKGKWRLPLLATFLVDCKLAKLPPAEDDPPPLPAEIVNKLSAIDNPKLQKLSQLNR